MPVGQHHFHRGPVTANLLEESARRGVQRFAHLSASVGYELADRFPLREDASGGLAPAAKYGLSELVRELLCGA